MQKAFFATVQCSCGPWTTVPNSGNDDVKQAGQHRDKNSGRRCKAHFDPTRCLRSVGRQRDDRQPGVAQTRRCVGAHARTGFGGCAGAWLCAQQDRGRVGQPKGQSGWRHHPVPVEHGVPRGDDRHFRRARQYRPATGGGRNQLPARARRDGAVRDAVVAALGHHHCRAGTYGCRTRDDGAGRHPHGRDHGYRRHADGQCRRHLAPPRRAPDGRGDHGLGLPQYRLSGHPDGGRFSRPQTAGGVRRCPAPRRDGAGGPRVLFRRLGPAERARDDPSRSCAQSVSGFSVLLQRHDRGRRLVVLPRQRD